MKAICVNGEGLAYVGIDRSGRPLQGCGKGGHEISIKYSCGDGIVDVDNMGAGARVV